MRSTSPISASWELSPPQLVHVETGALMSKVGNLYIEAAMITGSPPEHDPMTPFGLLGLCWVAFKSNVSGAVKSKIVRRRAAWTSPFVAAEPAGNDRYVFVRPDGSVHLPKRIGWHEGRVVPLAEAPFPVRAAARRRAIAVIDTVRDNDWRTFSDTSARMILDEMERRAESCIGA